MRTCLFVVSFFLLNIAAYGQALFVKQDSVAAVLKEFIKRRVRYPAVAAENEISGRIILGFGVDLKKKITEIEIIQGLFAACDSAAVTVLRQYNKPLQLQPSRYALAVNFVLYNGKGILITAPNNPFTPSSYPNFLFEVDNVMYLPQLHTSWIVDRAEVMPFFNNFKGKVKRAEITVKSPPNATDSTGPDEWKLLFEYDSPGVLRNQKTIEYTFDSVNRLVFQPKGDGQVVSSKIYNADKHAGLKVDLAQLKMDSVNNVQTKLTYDAQGRRVREDVFKDGKLHYYKYWNYNAQGLCTEMAMVAVEDGLIFKDNYKYNNSGWLSEKITDQTPKWKGKKTFYTYTDLDRWGNWRKLTITTDEDWHETKVARKISYFD